MRTPFCLIAAFLFTACGTGFINKPIKDTGTATETDDDTSADSPADGDDPPPSTPDDTGLGDDTSTPDAPGISPTHPRLFFSPSDLPQLQAQVFDFDRAALITRWDTVVTGWRAEEALPFPDGSSSTDKTDDEWAHIAGPLPNLAMYALFTEDEEAKAQTVTWIQQVSNHEDWGTIDEANIGRGATQTLQAMCIAYDMLHDKFAVEERVSLRTRLIQQAGKLYRALTGDTPPAWANQWNSRDAQLAHTALLMAGLAMEHDHDDAALWLNQSRNFIDATMNQLEDSADGSWPEGPSIGSDTLTSLFQSLFLIDRHFGSSWGDHPWLSNHSDAMLRSTLPGQNSVLAVGDGTNSWIRGPEHQACFSDMHSPAPVATWIAEQHLLLEEQPSRLYELWLEFLWCDPDVTGLAPGVAMPPSHLFQQWNVGIWASGQTATDSSLSFTVGPPSKATGWTDESAADVFAIGELHPAAGSFSWSPKGQPVITAGGTQIPKRTALANTYTFSPMEASNRDWDGIDRTSWWSSGTFQNDVGNLARVGQRGEWGLDFGPANDLIDADAGMDLVETRRGVTVMVGHFGDMYPTEFRGETGWWDLGIQRLTRTIVILPQEVILLFDHLEHSTDLSHHARFQSTTGSFSVAGATGNITTPDGNTWSIDVASGGGLSTGSHIQRIDEPSGTWVNHLEVTNSAYAGAHNNLYILRSSTQTVATTWTPSDEGVTAQIDVASEGTTESYVIRLATSEDPLERQSFLSFSGWVGVQQGSETEIRF